MYKEKRKIDLYQTLQYGAFGLFVAGPYMRYWWYALELKIFKNANTKLRPVKMMLLDQVSIAEFFVSSPFFYLKYSLSIIQFQAISPYILNGAFLYYLSSAEGKTHSEAIERVKKSLMPIVIESYKLWPWVMLANFYYIPLHNR
jgi:hypothetical protein